MLHMATASFWAETFHRKPLSRQAMRRHVTGLLLDGLQHGEIARQESAEGERSRRSACVFNNGIAWRRSSWQPWSRSPLAGCSRKSTTAYQGYVEGKFVYVASPQSGRLDHLPVARGETISVSHPLFALDSEPEAAAERQAQQMLRVSEATLADLRTGKRAPEIDVTQAELQQALADKKQADEILKSYETQYRAGGIPLTDLINAQAAAESSAAKVHQLQSQLAVDALPARDEQIRAQSEQVAADRAGLEQATWKLQQKEIVSPRQGLVFDTLYREGEWVAAGNPVVELLPPENVEVRFFVPETVVGKLEVGQNSECIAMDVRRTSPQK